MEKENPTILVSWESRIREFMFSGNRKSENSRFMGIENARVLVLSESKIGEFMFCEKRESDNSRFVEKEN